MAGFFPARHSISSDSALRVAMPVQNSYGTTNGFARQRGASLAYVRDQMGHASISMTVNVYSSWLPKSDVAAVNRVFGQDVLGRVGSKAVADALPEAVGGL